MTPQVKLFITSKCKYQNQVVKFDIKRVVDGDTTIEIILIQYGTSRAFLPCVAYKSTIPDYINLSAACTGCLGDIVIRIDEWFIVLAKLGATITVKEWRYKLYGLIKQTA